MASYLADGIVLSRRNLGEKDRVLDLFTREYGRIPAVAKGSRRPGSRFGGISEAFTRSRFQLAEGRSLDIVTQAEVVSSYPRVREDLDKIAVAAYLCELTQVFTTEREPAEHVHDLLTEALSNLEHDCNNREFLAHRFALLLLSERGYAPQLTSCVQCGVRSDQFKSFSAALGGVLCPIHSNAHSDAIRLNREVMEYLRVAADGSVSAHSRLDDGISASRCIKWYIRVRAERSIRSLEFLESLQSSRAVAS